MYLYKGLICSVQISIAFFLWYVIVSLEVVKRAKLEAKKLNYSCPK